MSAPWPTAAFGSSTACAGGSQLVATAWTATTDWERRHLGGAWKGTGRWPDRHLAASRSNALAKTPRTPKTPRTAPACTSHLEQTQWDNGSARKPTLPPSWVSWVSWVSWPARQKMKSIAGGPPTPSGTSHGTPPLTGNAAILAAHDWKLLRPMFSPFANFEFPLVFGLGMG